MNFDEFGAPESGVPLTVDEARSAVDDLPVYRQLETQDETAIRAWEEDYTYWRTHYPTVVLRWQDNPQIDAAAINRKWTGSPSSMPIVNVQVTQRKKPEPERFLGGVLDYVAPLIGAIPIVGTPLAIASSMALNAEAISFQQSMSKVGPEIFAPQINPVTFTVPLPLDRAQAAVEQPWLIPFLFEQFQRELDRRELLDLNASYYQMTGEEPPELIQRLAAEERGETFAPSDSIIDNPWMIAGAAGIGLTILIGLVWVVRK